MHLYDLQRIPDHTLFQEPTNPLLIPPCDVWIVNNWGWIIKKVSKESIIAKLKNIKGALESLHISALQATLPEPDIIISLGKRLGAHVRRERKALSTIASVIKEQIKVWPPPAPPFPLPGDTGIASITSEFLPDNFDSYKNWAVAFPNPLRHPYVREKIVESLQIAGFWDPPKGKRLSHISLYGRSQLEELRILDPFEYESPNESDRCKHRWIKLTNCWAGERRWLCLECWRIFMCSCDAEVLKIRSHSYSNTPVGLKHVLKKVCPSCRGLPDLNPPSPVRLMYHSTMFDVIHEREMKNLVRDTIIAKSKNEKISFEEAQEKIREEKPLHWAKNIIREKHGFHKVSGKWVSELTMINVIKQAFPNNTVVHQASPAWIKPQRFDAYIPSLKLAFEYHGVQHFEPVELFGGESGLKQREQLDERKRILCQEQGVKLIEFSAGEGISVQEVLRRAKLE